MKLFPNLLLLIVLLNGCKSDVDPRDQYIASYKLDLGYPSEYYLIVNKGTGLDELRLKFGTDDYDFMARLTGSTFNIPNYERFYKDASGVIRSSGTVEGTGFFENKKIELNLKTVDIVGKPGTNKIVAYRIN